MGFGFTASLQKKLLFYILQKISILSNVNLSDVDVSLGPNSQFKFYNVSLNTDDINLQDLDIEEGTLEQLDIQLTISGALNIVARNLLLVLKTKKSLLNRSSIDEANDPISFSLSKSLHDLTTSMMLQLPTTVDITALDELNQYDDEINEDPEGIDTQLKKTLQKFTSGSSFNGEDNIIRNEEITDDGQKGAPSTMQLMKNKVLSNVLSKFKLNVVDCTVRFILNDTGTAYLDVVIDDILLNNDETGSREMVLNSLIINATCTNNFQKLPARSKSTISRVKESLEDSTSLYMSAYDSFDTSEDKEVSFSVTEGIIDPDKLMNEEEGFLKLLELHSLTIKIGGLNITNDFKIHETDIRLSDLSLYYNNVINLDPAIATLLLDIGFQNIESSSSDESISPNSLANYKRFQQEQKLLAPSIKFTGLLREFNLLISNEVLFKFENIQFSTSEINNLNVILERFLPIMEGTTTEVKENVFGTIDCTDKGIYIKINNEINFIINKTSLLDIFTIYHRTISIFKKYKHDGIKIPKYATVPKSRKQFTIKTEEINFSLLLDTETFDIQIAPMNYKDEEPFFNLDYINIYRQIVNRRDSVASILSLSGERGNSPLQVPTFDDNFKKSTIFTSFLLTIEKIIIHDNYESLRSSLRELTFITSLFEKEAPSTGKEKPFKATKGNIRILNSSNIFFSDNTIASAFVKVNQVSLNVGDFMNSMFGTLDVTLKNNDIIFNSNGDFSYNTSFIRVLRQCGNVKNTLISTIHLTNDNLAVLTIEKKANNKIKLYGRNIEFHFHSRLLPFLDKEKPESSEVKGEGIDDSFFTIDGRMTNCSLLLYPYRIKPALLLMFNDLSFHLNSKIQTLRYMSKDINILLIDDISKMKISQGTIMNPLADCYHNRGFITIGKMHTLSSTFIFGITGLNINISVNMMYLSLCADSFNTLLPLLIDLKIPITFPDEEKFKSSFKRDLNLMNDIELNYFNSSQIKVQTDNYDIINDNEVNIINEFIDKSASSIRSFEDNMSVTDLSNSTSSSAHINNSIILNEDYLDTVSPMRSSIFSLTRDISINFDLKNISLKLFDGYDWKYTRKEIAQTIDLVGDKVTAAEECNDVQPHLQTTVFDSILIATTKSDVPQLKYLVNNDIQSEREHVQFLNKVNLKPSRHHKMELEASSVSLKATIFQTETSISSNDSAQILNSFDLSIEKYKVIDNLASSTWNKFLTILRHDKWHSTEPMLSLKYSIVKPIQSLKAVESIISLRLAPLRFHVDQDSLDFFLRFMEFQDPRFALVDEYPELTFIQKFSMNSVKIVLDYKPKKISYSGLRSGHSEEFVNFFILEGAKIILKGIKLYGLNGFENLGLELKNNWVPDILATQLGGIIGGVSSLKPAITIGSNIKTAVTVPIKDYRQDSNITRSVKKGVDIFLKTAGGDFVRVGAKLASGTQAILENTEEFFGGKGSSGRTYYIPESVVNVESIIQEDQLVGGTNPKVKNQKPSAIILDSTNLDGGYPKVVSLYADQPVNLHQGLEEAYRALEKNLYIAYDSIKDYSKASQKEHDFSIAPNNTGPTMTALSAAKAAPIAIIRPLIGATEAISKTLLGISNQLNEDQLQNYEDKYKTHSKR